MAAVTGLTIIKRFTYRGDATEEWSNTYHLKDAVPSNDAAWLTLANEIITHEKDCFPASSKAVRAYGYATDDPSDHAVWTHDYLAAGTAVSGTLPAIGNHMAGDQAAVIFWKTSRLNSKGKYIYLRKYMHDGYTDSSVADNIYSGYRTAMSSWASYIAPRMRSQKHDETITASGALPNVTTRTLKRRGKRPLG